MYEYSATVIRVYDGDTFIVEIDLGFNITFTEKIRLAGIDTPELRGDEREEGLRVRDYVSNIILGRRVDIMTYKDKKGKYGRYLADVYIMHEGKSINIAQHLLENKMGKAYG